MHVRRGRCRWGCLLPQAWLSCACLREEWSDGVAIITHVHPDGSCDLKHPSRRTRERRVPSRYIQVVPRVPSNRGMAIQKRHTKRSEPRPEAAAAVPSEEIEVLLPSAEPGSPPPADQQLQHHPTPEPGPDGGDDLKPSASARDRRSKLVSASNSHAKMLVG